ncbi:MAG TPA: YkgJ family cysteine cluster protein [Kofleriaceae bacterium]|jgi:hypothetical protein
MADEPVTRAELERALRGINLRHVDLRDALLQLAARVVVLTDELTRRLDGVEPLPAPPLTPAPVATATVERAVAERLDGTLAKIRGADVMQPSVALDEGGDKYTAPVAGPNCAELLHLCQARCCTLGFSLSTADLDEGVIRWDYGKPYMIRQRASDGYCVHNDEHHGCTVHAQRPRVCRVYDCRDDKRIWTDFANRLVAPPGTTEDAEPALDLLARVRARSQAISAEQDALENRVK